MKMNRKDYYKWINKNFWDFKDAINYGAYDTYGRNASKELSNSKWEGYTVLSKTYDRYVLSKYKNRLTITNLKTNNYGSSWLHPYDKFDLATGIAIAWARLKNEPIPEIDDTLVKITDLKPNDVFEYHLTRYYYVGEHPAHSKEYVVVECLTGKPRSLTVHGPVKKI